MLFDDSQPRSSSVIPGRPGAAVLEGLELAGKVAEAAAAGFIHPHSVPRAGPRAVGRKLPFAPCECGAGMWSMQPLNAPPKSQEKLVKLLLKFNLIFVLVMALGVAVSGYISRNLLQQQRPGRGAEQRAAADGEGQRRARLHLDADHPLLQTQMKYEFLPQTVPSYSATEVLGTLQTQVPRVRLQGSHAEPDQPARPRRRLGGRHRQRTSATTPS